MTVVEAGAKRFGKGGKRHLSDNGGLCATTAGSRVRLLGFSGSGESTALSMVPLPMNWKTCKSWIQISLCIRTSTWCWSTLCTALPVHGVTPALLTTCFARESHEAGKLRSKVKASEVHGDTSCFELMFLHFNKSPCRQTKMMEDVETDPVWPKKGFSTSLR